MRYRITKRVADFGEIWFFPEYYVGKFFFGFFGGYWSEFMEWEGCDPLGFDYGYGYVKFKTKLEAENFLENEQGSHIEVIEYQKKETG